MTTKFKPFFAGKERLFGFLDADEEEEEEDDVAELGVVE